MGSRREIARAGAAEGHRAPETTIPRFARAAGGFGGKIAAQSQIGRPEAGLNRKGSPRRKWGPVLPPAPTLPLDGPAGAAPSFGDRFRPRPFGLGRFRRGCRVARGSRKFRYAVRSVRRLSVPPRFRPPEGLRSRVRALEESGFGSFRLSPSRASRFFLEHPTTRLAAVLPFLRTSKPLRRGGSGWLLYDPFPVRRSSGHPCKLAGAAESHNRNHPVDKKDNGDKIGGVRLE
jgi:hypothetical protein